MKKIFSVMVYDKLYKKLENLKLDKKLLIYDNDEYEIYVLRPSKLDKEYKAKNYDVNKNLQIWLKKHDTGYEFMPTHLRVLINLKLMVMNQPELVDDLSIAFDKIFYKEDPINVTKNINITKRYIDDLDITAVLTQLFLIEQEVSFAGESKYDPKSLWFQGWIRTFLNEPKEIEKVVKSIFGFGGTYGAPKEAYTKQDNKKKPKSYNPNAQPLWYKK